MSFSWLPLALSVLAFALLAWLLERLEKKHTASSSSSINSTSSVEDASARAWLRRRAALLRDANAAGTESGKQHRTRMAIVVVGGAFCPPHREHLVHIPAALRAVEMCLEMPVLCVVMEPMPDIYLHIKLHGKKPFPDFGFIPVEHRVALLRLCAIEAERDMRTGGDCPRSPREAPKPDADADELGRHLMRPNPLGRLGSI
jgi:hypothetical protein